MQSPSKRGRPQEADPHEVSRIALRLFERQGFDQVTMDQIAAAAGLSRRTLFRLFPSKSDLVWAGVTEIRDVVKLRAATLMKTRVPLAQLIDKLFVPILRPLDEPAAAKLARRRLRLIARAPALLNHTTLLEIEAVLATVVTACKLPARTPPSLVARTLVATTFAALLWWADHDKELSPLEAARAAWKTLALGGRRG